MSSDFYSSSPERRSRTSHLALRTRTFALALRPVASRRPTVQPPEAPVTESRFPNLTVISHPLIQHKLSVLRDKETSKKKFKELVDEIAMLMAYEVTKDLPLEPVEIETPLEKTTQMALSGKKLTVVPILRAGLGMVDGVVRLMPGV